MRQFLLASTMLMALPICLESADSTNTCVLTHGIHPCISAQEAAQRAEHDAKYKVFLEEHSTASLKAVHDRGVQDANDAARRAENYKEVTEAQAAFAATAAANQKTTDDRRVAEANAAAFAASPAGIKQTQIHYNGIILFIEKNCPDFVPDEDMFSSIKSGDVKMILPRKMTSEQRSEAQPVIDKFEAGDGGNFKIGSPMDLKYKCLTIGSVLSSFPFHLYHYVGGNQ
jgi:hypothetical protein